MHGSAKQERSAPAASFPHNQQSTAVRLQDALVCVVVACTRAARGLKHAPLVAAVLVASVAIGTGVNATMFSVIDTLMLRQPMGVVGPQRVERLTAKEVISGERDTMVGAEVSYPEFSSLRDGGPLLDGIVAYVQTPMAVGGDANGQKINAEAISPSFFEFIGVHLFLGRPFTVGEGAETSASHVVVISHALWRRLFASDTQVVGRQLVLNATAFTIIGVAPRGFVGVDQVAADAWVPLASAAASVGGVDWAVAAHASWLNVLVRVPVAMSIERAQQVVRQRASADLAPSDGRQTEYYLTPLLVDRGPLRAPSAKIALWLGAVALALAFIACGNVGNILLVRALHRRHEMAVRLALGASRQRLIGLMFAESAVIAMAGAVAGLAIYLPMASLVRSALASDVASAQSTFSWRMLLFTMLFAVLTALLCGTIPGLTAMRTNVSTIIKQESSRGPGRRVSVARQAILMLQASLVVVLLFGANLFGRSLLNLRRMPLGIDTRDVLMSRVDFSRSGYKAVAVRALLNDASARVREIDGVSRTSLSTALPFVSADGLAVFVPGRRRPNLGSETPYMNGITSEYFRTVGTKIVSGRAFVEADRKGTERVAIVNETFARLAWPYGKAEGQCVALGVPDASCVRVVGVAANARRLTVVEDSTMQIYLPLGQDEFAGAEPLYLLARCRIACSDLVQPVRRAIAAAMAGAPVSVTVRPLQDFIEPQLRPWTIGATMFELFSALAASVGAVGVYAVVAFSVRSRRRELAVRMALGAKPLAIVWTIMTPPLVATVCGIVIGSAVVAVAGQRFNLTSLLVGVRVTDPLVVLSVILTTLGIAALGCMVPIHRAVTIDPAVSLRVE